MSDLTDNGSCGCGCSGHGGEDHGPPSRHDWEKASDDELVCYCAEVNKGQIRQAVEMGAYTLPLVKVATGACRGNDCEQKHPRGTGCAADVMELIRIYHQGPPHWVTSGECCG